MKEVSRNGHDSGAGFSFLNDAVYNDPQTDVRNDNSAYTGDVYRDPLSGNTYACLEEKLSEATYSRENPAHSRVAAFDLIKPAKKRDIGERLNDPTEISEDMTARMLTYRNMTTIRDQAVSSLGPNLGNHGPVRRTNLLPPGTAIGTRTAGTKLQDPVWARDAGGPGSDYTVRLPRTARSDINCASRGTGPQMTGNHRPGIPNNLVNSRMTPDPRGRQTMSSVNLRQDTRNAQYMMVASNKNRFNVESTHVGGGTTFGHVGHRHGEGELLSYMSSKREHRQEAHHNSGASSLHGGSTLEQAWGRQPSKNGSVYAGPPTAAAQFEQNRRPQSHRTYTERPGAGMGSLRARNMNEADKEFMSARNPDNDVVVGRQDVTLNSADPSMQLHPLRRRVDHGKMLLPSQDLSAAHRDAEPSVVNLRGIQPEQLRERGTATANRVMAESFTKGDGVVSATDRSHQTAQGTGSWARVSRRMDATKGRESHARGVAPASSQPRKAFTRHGRPDGERMRTTLGDGAGSAYPAHQSRTQSAERQAFREKGSMAPKIASVLDDRGGHGGGVRSSSILTPADRRALISKYSRMMKDRQSHDRSQRDTRMAPRRSSEQGNLRPPTRAENGLRLDSRLDGNMAAAPSRHVLEDPLQTTARSTSRRIPFE